MSLTEQQVGILAVERLKLPRSAALGIQTFIDSALNNLALDTVNDIQKRKWLITDPANINTSVTTSTGRPYSDLSTVIAQGVMLDYLNYGTIFWLPAVTATPFLSAGGYAGGYWTFAANPVDGETIVVNGITFTFKLPPGVQVSDAPNELNGRYTERGTFGAHPYYNQTGTPDDPTTSSIFYDGFQPWVMTDDISDQAYWGIVSVGHDALYPWTAFWTNAGGFPPQAVTVTDETTPLTSVQVEIGETTTETATNFATTLNASVNGAINVAFYTAESNVVSALYKTIGSGGNSYTLANSSGSSVLRSGATLTGGAALSYGFSISTLLASFKNLDRVRFTTTGSYPTGLVIATDYYITNYTNDGVTATFLLSSTPDGLTPAIVSTAGTGILTVSQQDISGSQILQWLTSPNQGQLISAVPIAYPTGYLIDTKIYLNNAGGGTLAFAVPFVPDLTTLPAFLENDLLDQVVDLALAAGAELPKEEAVR